MNVQKAVDEPLIEGVAPDIVCERFSNGQWARTSVPVPVEMALTIYVNDEELVTILCTPAKLNCLVLGYLYSEGIITGISEVTSMRVCEEDSLADVKLSKLEFTLPERRTLTSGCGGGVSLTTQGQKVNSSLEVTPAQVLPLMAQMQEQAELFRFCGGVHTSALADTESLLVVAEDIGRHNTLDKIQGECLLRGISTKDGLLLATGRLSSEMVLKAAKMGTPIVVTRSSPTDRAISLARDLGVTLVGYARGSRLSVYSCAWRLGLAEIENSNMEKIAR